MNATTDAASYTRFDEPKGDTIISRKIILKPRKIRYCEVCGKKMLGPQARLFGRACTGDKPYVVYTHVSRRDCRMFS